MSGILRKTLRPFMDGLEACVIDDDISPFLINGGALDVDNCPICWELIAHRARYVFAARVFQSMRVLDFGCGIGYGSVFLQTAANNEVTSVDPSSEARTLALTRRNVQVLPEIPAGAIYDGCVAFEVIEHLPDPEHFVLTVPARHLVASVPVQPSVGHNPYHRSDFTIPQFRALIEKRFTVRHWWTQTRPFRAEAAYMIVHGEAL